MSSAPMEAVPGGESRICIRTADLGDVGAVSAEVRKRGKPIIRASGSGLDAESALVPALAEGLERYSMSIFSNDQFIWATANELGGEALDLDALPRCSPSELSHPKCPLILPDKSQRIRWVRGLSLFDGSLTWIPAVLVYAQIGYAAPEERFWLPISTGCAAHRSYEQALLAAIYEIAERDIISIAWLQQLPLPRIEIDDCPPTLAPYWERYMAAFAGPEYLFFDATSDLRVPTVYGLRVAPANPRVTTLVACSTGFTAVDALAKAMGDLAALSVAFRKEWPLPKSWDDFTDLLHGASFMARSDSARAFQFLLHTDRTIRLSDLPGAPTPNMALRRIVDRLKEKKLETYVVDLSTDEAIRADMRVLRVIIPGLQPLSFRYRARFLGHPRLYTAPVAMGYPSSSEEGLNPWPQPFA